MAIPLEIHRIKHINPTNRKREEIANANSNVPEASFHPSLALYKFLSKGR